MRRSSGFTLVELVVALTLSVVVAGFVAMFVGVPVQAYFSQTRRSELAYSAESTTRWLSRDVRSALPNSVRAGVAGGSLVLEMIDVAAVTVYRDAGPEGDFLDFAIPDNQFEVLGPPGVTAVYVVVDNRGSWLPAQDAYSLANVIAPAAINAASATIVLTPAFRFVSASTHRRAFLVSSVTRYECDVAAGTLRRYVNQPLTPNIVALPGGTPSTLIARDVTACRFTPTQGNTEHGGLLVVEITISRATNGAVENLRVMKQLRVENAG